MSAINVPRIAALWQNPMAEPIRRDERDADAVGVIQDLLSGHGFRLPGIMGSGRGSFGPQTKGAVAAFQGAHDQEPTGEVDHSTLHLLVEKDSVSPVAACGYVTLALEMEWRGFIRLVGLTAQFEAAGKFTAINPNSDRAGLSFGIIQWAQKPKRLNEILRSFETTQPNRFIEIFGAGDKSTASGVLTHTAKDKGGVDSFGRTTDPHFDLVNGIWTARFKAAGQNRKWQKTQINEAVTAFRKAREGMRVFTPTARSERALAFLLDVANQHGPAGLENICAACVRPGMDEAAMLKAVEEESVRRVLKQFGEGNEVKSTQNRRSLFRQSPLLLSDQFEEA